MYRDTVAMMTLTAMVASCSSKDMTTSSDNSNLSQTEYLQYGVVALRRNTGTFFDSLSTFEGGFANFIKRDQKVSFEEVLNNYRLPLDTCTTYDQPFDVIGNSGAIPSYIAPGDNNVTFLSAGEVITIDSVTGSWLDVVRGPMPFYQYTNASSIVKSSPESLTLNISGDEFPEYTNVSIPSVDPVVLITPELGEILQLDTEFTWIPSESNNAYLRITAEKLIGSKRFHLDCMAIDDGNFKVPTTVQAELGSLFKDYPVRVNRTVYSTQAKDDSILFVFHSVGSD